MNDRKCALYRITHRQSGKDYVGISVEYKARWAEHKRASRQGGTRCPKLYNALRKHGPDAFDWKVIAWARNFEAGCKLERMARHLGLGDAYNCTDGGEGVVGLKMSEKTREILRKANTGRVHSEETKRRISDGNKGKVVSDSTKSLLSAARKGIPAKPFSPEHCAKLSSTTLGKKKRPWSAEAKAKLSLSRVGRKGTPHTNESKAKISQSKKGKRQNRKITEQQREALRVRSTGRKHSPETQAKMSAAQTLRWAKHKEALAAKNGVSR
jgi:group I intron endonuclease